MVDEQYRTATATAISGPGIRPIRSIVVGTDGSDGAERALDWAAAEADRNSASLLIIGACLYNGLGDETEGERTTRAVLEAAQARIAERFHDVDVKHQLVQGIGAEALIEGSRAADLLVVGSRGLGGFRGLLLGSVGQHCVTHAPCTVTIVRHRDGRPSAQEPWPPRRIVVGVDGSEPSTEALRWAVGEARRSGAALHVIGSAVFPGDSGPLLVAAAFPDAARDIVEQALQEVGRLAAEVTVDGAITENSPAPALVQASKEADLVVVGSRGIGAFRVLLLGSVSQHVAHHAHCAVTVVRGQTD